MNSLPTELLRQIIHSSVPSTYHSTTYKDRQATLRALCRVSRRFLHIAQPLLSAILRINHRWRKSRGANIYAELRKGVSQALIWEERGNGKTNVLERLASTSPGLVSLNLVHGYSEALDLSALSRFSQLETVRIYCTEIELGRSPFITLTSLTIELFDNGIPLQTLLSPSTLPSLRVLAFTQADEEDFAGMALLPPFLSLFEQLDAFQLEASAMTSIANVRIRHLLDKTLFEGGSAALCDYSRIYHFIHHLRIPIGALHSKLTDHFMKTDDLPLRSLYLDSSLRHYSVEQATNQQHRILLSACRARQIDVVYEEQAKEDFFDSVVSHEFWRRQRERKRSKAAGSI